MIATSFVMLFILAIFFITIPLIIGVYVYHDAKSRGMSAALWTLVASLAPSLIGFIIYLLVRGSYSNLKCPNCATSVKETYTVCPACGVKLKATCPNCSVPVDTGWKVCPHCAQQLPEFQNDYTPPVKRKDKALSKILAVVIIIPIVLCISGIVLFRVAGTPSSSSTGITSYTVDDYLHTMDNEQITEWFKSSHNELSKAYVLRYVNEEDSDSHATYYAIYIPTVGEEGQESISVSHGLFRNNLEIEFNPHGQVGNVIHCVTSYSDIKLGLKIYCNGKKIDSEIIDVTFNPVPSESFN